MTEGMRQKANRPLRRGRCFMAADNRETKDRCLRLAQDRLALIAEDDLLLFYGRSRRLDAANASKWNEAFLGQRFLTQDVLTV